MTKIIVDIDGTICNNTNGEYHLAKPFPERIKKLNAMRGLGYEIHYWTARGSGSGKDWRELTKKQLDEWGCQYDSWSVGKPSYDVWIDDKAFNADSYFEFLDK